MDALTLFLVIGNYYFWQVLKYFNTNLKLKNLLITRVLNFNLLDRTFSKNQTKNLV